MEEEAVAPSAGKAPQDAAPQNAAPQNAAPRDAAPQDAAPPDEAGFGAAIDTWLRLWLVHNALLVGISLAILSRRGGTFTHLLEAFALGGLANAAFLFGPAVELYSRKHGYRGALLRWYLFSMGLLVSGGLACVALLVP